MFIFWPGFAYQQPAFGFCTGLGIMSEATSVVSKAGAIAGGITAATSKVRTVVAPELWELPWESLLFASGIAAFFGVVSRLRKIEEGSLDWRSFWTAAISGGCSGLIVSALMLGNKADPLYVFAAMVVFGLLGGKGLDLILNRGAKQVEGK